MAYRHNLRIREMASKHAMLFLAMWFLLISKYISLENEHMLQFYISILHFHHKSNGSTWKYTLKFVGKNLEITGKLPKLEIGEFKFAKALGRACQIDAAVLLWMSAYMIWRLTWIFYTDIYSLEFSAKWLLLVLS